MVRPLKIGVQLPEVEYEYTWPQLAGMAQTAERIGLDSIWLGDHLMYRYEGVKREPRGPFEAWTTLAALAAVTERVELGPLVASIGFHAPAMIAKMAATIDQISGGRFILALGSGWHQPEYKGFGFSFDKRVARFEESFTIIRSLLETGACDFSGEFNSVEGGLLFPRPVRPGGIPIMLGSRGPKMMAIALPYVDMWNAWFEDWGNNLSGLKALLAELDEACVLAGRDPATLVRSICPLVRMAGGIGRLSDYPGDANEKPLDGTDPEALADELRAYAGLGIGHVQLVLDPITAESIAALQPMLDLLDR
jgi:alkanesulfonate monooxygenase SsuD/methylene tetrahydromethanopterin reductase-like flavin-dependent oxidoreductase (luciferase family)